MNSQQSIDVLQYVFSRWENRACQWKPLLITKWGKVYVYDKHAPYPVWSLETALELQSIYFLLTKLWRRLNYCKVLMSEVAASCRSQ